MKDDDDDSESDNSDNSTSSKSEEASHRHNTSKLRSLLRQNNDRKNGYDIRNHGTKRKRGRARRGRRDAINRRKAPRVIIEPVTEIDVIGGVGWCIINVVEGTTASMGGALAGMGERRLPIVSAVTAYDHKTQGPILIGHGQVAWDDQP